MFTAAQSGVAAWGVLLLCWHGLALAEAQVLPTAPNALATRAPDVEWGMLPAKQVTANKPEGGGAEEPDRRDARVSVSGLKGTLNRDDVHQTMDTRKRALDACVKQVRRSAEFVSGALQFAFKVDGHGRVIQVRPLGPSIGHLGLEQCITQVLSETQFPEPSGRAVAEFTWGMKVEGARGAQTKGVRDRGVAASVRKHRRALWERCEVPRRARYRVTAYVSSSGHVLSAGAVARPGHEEPLACLVEELRKLQLPKQKRLAKVQFDLR